LRRQSRLADGCERNVARARDALASEFVLVSDINYGCAAVKQRSGLFRGDSFN